MDKSAQPARRIHPGLAKNEQPQASGGNWLASCYPRAHAVAPPTSRMTSILDSRRLLAFATLARIGSFTLAAQELHLTQSAVSHAIKALEDELGLRLFERRGRRVALTPAGRQLLVRAQRILAEMQDARADLATLSR